MRPFSFFLGALWRMCSKLYDKHVQLIFYIIYKKFKDGKLIYLLTYFDLGPSYWNEEPPVDAAGPVVSFCPCRNKMAELVFGIDFSSQQFTRWLCLHHRRNVPVTCAPEWSLVALREPVLCCLWSNVSQVDLYISLKEHLEQDRLTGGFHTHYGVSLSAVSLPKELLLSLIYSTLPLFSRPVAIRDAQVVLWLQGERCPE